MNVLKLTSPVCCSVNHYLKVRPFIAGGKPMATVYETAEAKKYKRDFVKYIKNQVKIQNFSIIPNKTQHFYADCVFYFDRICRDANNCFKLLLDAITDSKCVWIDDNTACERVQGIFYDSKNPRIEIVIYPVDYIGIFPNTENFKEFESVCEGCTKYRDGRCGILKKAVEGRIQEEISGLKCSKYKQKLTEELNGE
jgi:Holliday junction resolvase RusA-like endonuclease